MQNHFFLASVNSEQIDSNKTVSRCVSRLQMILLLTYSRRPPPFLSLSVSLMMLKLLTALGS